LYSRHFLLNALSGFGGLVPYSDYIFPILGFVVAIGAIYWTGRSTYYVFFDREQRDALLPPKIAIQFTMGLLVHFYWFYLRSFLAAFGMSIPVVPLEPFLIISILQMAQHLKKTACRPVKTQIRWLGLCTTMLFVGTMEFGWWRFFNLVPASLDPTTIAAYADRLREAGLITGLFFQTGPTIYLYPSGAMVLTSILGTPFNSSISLVQILPHLFTTLAWMMGAEIVLMFFAKNRRKNKSVILIFFALVFIVRTTLGAYDMHETWRYHEGELKRILFPFTLFCVFAYSRFVEVIKNNEEEIWVIKKQSFALVFFFALSSGLMVLVNPVNLSVAVSLSMSFLLTTILSTLICYIRHKTSPRSFTTGFISGLAGCLVAALILAASVAQDLRFTAKLGNGHWTCGLPFFKLNHCMIPDGSLRFGEKIHAIGEEKDVASMKESLFYPDFSENLGELFLPQKRLSSLGADERKSMRFYVILSLIAAIALGIQLVKRLGLFKAYKFFTSSSQQMFAALMFISFLLIFVGPLAKAQAIILAKSLNTATSHLIKPYIELSYINLWYGIFIIIFSLQLFPISVQLYALKGIVHQSKLKKTIFPLLLVTLGLGVYYGNCDVARERRDRIWQLSKEVRWTTPEFARIFLMLDDSIENSPVIGNNSAMTISSEHWRVNDSTTGLLMLYLSQEVHYGTWPSWPYQGMSPDEFDRFNCENDCQIAKKFAISYAIGWSKEPFPSCGKSRLQTLHESPCFTPVKRIDSKLPSELGYFVVFKLL
jgi:hypothetical protein